MKSTGKIIVIMAAIAAVFLTAVLPLAAEGVQERQETGGSWSRKTGYGRAGVYGPGTAAEGLPVAESLSLTGTIAFTAAHPILKTNEGSYRLMYPLFLGQEADLKNGQKVGIEGYVVPGPRWEDDGEADEKYLRVSKAIIDDKEFLIGGPNPGSFHGGFGKRPGMAGRNSSPGRPDYRQDPRYQTGPGARGGRR
jgi:hypothetical protein